jgi:RNA polymerase sigma-70 factor (ECF subfamily)
MENLSDRELVTRSLGGDLDAYSELVLRCQGPVFNVCYRLLGEQREAEDLTQEAFIRAYQRLASFDLARPFAPWIRRIAANLCLNQLKARPDCDLALDDWSETLSAEPEATPAVIQERVEGARTVHRLIVGLPPLYRAVIELSHFQELSYAEIGQVLHLPVSDVKSYLFRARRLLAERIKTSESKLAS